MPEDSVDPALPAAPVNPQSSNPHRTVHAFTAVVVLLASAVVALSLSGTAAAATPCGKQVLEDWFDNGRIDRIYKINCYEEGIDAIPGDLAPYADAEQVITRALQSALRGELPPEGGCDPSLDGSADDCKVGSGGTGENGGGGDPGAGDPQAAPGVDTSSPSSIPIPLLVLGGLSLALLAAGGLGYISRRRQAAHGDDLGDDNTLV